MDNALGPTQHRSQDASTCRCNDLTTNLKLATADRSHCYSAAARLDFGQLCCSILSLHPADSARVNTIANSTGPLHKARDTHGCEHHCEDVGQIRVWRHERAPIFCAESVADIKNGRLRTKSDRNTKSVLDSTACESNGNPSPFQGTGPSSLGHSRVCLAH